jgi:uncharacterized protein
MSSKSYIKYTTDDHSYIFDVKTNEIIRVSREIFDVIDDLLAIDKEGLFGNRLDHGNKPCCELEEALHKLKEIGITHENFSIPIIRTDHVLLANQKMSLGDFILSSNRLLLLEITQDCNLRCDYCCYSDFYPETRKHGIKVMSSETARQAVSDFLSRQNKSKSVISFYGGEPLLEFELIKEIVLYARDIKKDNGNSISFAMTTNGTLLSEEVIHFLVKQNFNILISLDGDKQTHDKHRVYRFSKRNGSFDTVYSNIQTFISLYPHYSKRGIATTLAATSDFQSINDFFKHLSPFFSNISANFVRNVQVTDKIDACLSNCHSCSLSFLNNSNSTHKKPEFCDWPTEQYQNFRLHFTKMVEMCKNSSLDDVKKTYPLFLSMLIGRTADIHYREVTRFPITAMSILRCLPGAVHLFCSVDGDYYPCERVDQCHFYLLGNVKTGFNTSHALSLINHLATLADCGNCCVVRFCPLCFSSLNNNGAIKESSHDICDQIKKDFVESLRYYTCIMEKNPTFYNSVCSESASQDYWLKDVRFVFS